MKIFYVNSEEFLKTHDTDFLRKYSDGQKFTSLKRFTQFSIGRWLVKSVGKDIYGLENTEITIIDNKPEFTTGKIKFSISHSGKYIAAAFDENECGLDIEEMKPRDLTSLSKRYNRNFDSMEDFYKFWTEYEATIKLHCETNGKYSYPFMRDYFLTVVSASPISSSPSCTSFPGV